MKHLIVVCLSLTVLMGMAGVAQASRMERARSAQATCVYKYLSCRDDCDYHQDAEQINPCKANCDRKYSCRPRKVKHNIGDNEGE